MNKDFHYEGTYAAAVIAGFSHNDAAKIAWAAQTVDECTRSNIKEHYPKFLKWNPVYTCESMKDNIWDEFSVLSDETSETLRNVRATWVPFHFLPGNTDGNAKYAGSAKDNLKERDIRDFLCMCQPNSSLVLAMINKASALFGRSNATERNSLLILLGILMHVLADTWAHQNFTGTPNAYINSISDFKPVPPVPEGYDSEHAGFGPTNYSILYLGHAQIGHNPDYGCLQYRYHPKWAADQKLFYIDGPENFCSAFVQMEWALRCISQGGAFSLWESAPSQSKKWLTAVRSVLSEPIADQSSIWPKQMLDFVNYESLPEYSFSGKDRDMQFFQSYAREHQAFVLSYLESWLNIMNI